MSEPKLLHVHGQPGQHDEVYIVGNREGLLALREAIDAALAPPSSGVMKAMMSIGASAGAGGVATVFRAMVQDGEEFEATVVLIDDYWQSFAWSRAVRPYTANYAKDNRDDKVMPWEHRKQ